LAVGEHKYAVNVPGGPGAAGEFTITPGGSVAKAARIEKSGPALDNNGIVLEKPKDEVVVFDFAPLAVPVDETPALDSWQPMAAAPGLGSIVWINHSGDDEMTVDLEGQLYKVPPQVKNIPGRLQIDVSPGLYRYTASVPFGSLNGEVTVVSGQVTGVNIIPGIREEPEFEVGEKVEIPPVDLTLFQEDLTNRVSVSQPDSAPGALPSTGGELAPTQIESTAEAEGLVIKNYAGDTLVFTINNQAYLIANNAAQTLTLPPGSYSYTASLPFVATTGTVDFAVGQSVELSIALDVNQNFLSVYQN
jgi:hypothetical protein